MKNVLLFLLAVLFLLIAGCSQGVDDLEPGNRFFDPQAVKVGDEIGGFSVAEVSLSADGTEKVVFRGSFTMTGVLFGNIVQGGGPNTYLIVFDREEILNTLPVADTWELGNETTFYLHTEEKVTAALGESRANRIKYSIEDPWSGIVEYTITASFLEFTYINDPFTGDPCILLLSDIHYIEEAADEALGSTRVAIMAFSEDPGAWGYNTIDLQGPSGEDYIVVVVEGEIYNFQLVELTYNADTGMMEEVSIIHQIDYVTDQSVVINTAWACGMPQEKIKWQSVSGNVYEWVIQTYGDETHWDFMMD
jgi:hypothetical protein